MTKQADIAKALKISQGTVSRALRGAPGVNRQMRQLVLAAASQAGYMLPAEDEVSCKSLVCVDIPHGDEWHERLISGVIAFAQGVGSEVITVPHTLGELPQVVVRRQVDGLIRLLSPSDYRGGRTVVQAPVPTVSVLYPVPGADVVSVDHFGSARALGLHLAGLRPGIVGYVGLAEPIGRARYYGLRSGLEEMDTRLPDELVRLCGTLEQVFVMPKVDELLDLRAAGRPEHQFTLLAFYNDYLARHAVERIRARGLRVPEDIGVAGYDDIAPPVAPDITLTTVHFPIEELGAAAVRHLERRRAHPDEPPVQVLLDAPVVEGNSVMRKG